MKSFNKDQIKEIRYQYDSNCLIELADKDPDAILLWEDKHQSVICKNGSDYRFGYDSALAFFKHRLSVNGNDLNALTEEMGYDGKPYFTRGDFLEDWLNSDEEALKALVIDNYNGERLGDWLYEE